MEEVKIGQRYFWKPGIFPYEVIAIDDKYITTKATYPTDCQPKRVYRAVFEQAIKNGIAEPTE